MKMMLSEFITKLEIVSNERFNPKVIQIISMLKINLMERGDIELDIDHMCKHFGIEI